MTRIVSDGLRTRVFVDGVQIQNVTAIRFGQTVKAFPRLELDVLCLDGIELELAGVEPETTSGPGPIEVMDVTELASRCQVFRRLNPPEAR